MKSVLMILVMLLCTTILPAQSLFENAVAAEAETSANELNGYVRGVFYAGKKYARKDQEMKSGYGETALKFRVRKNNMGDAYAELRFRNGTEYNRRVDDVSLREGYVNAYLGRFDVRMGQQIVVWGRADGFNPTNNLTPYSMLTRSPNEDDRRVSNFLMRGWYNFYPFRLEAVWVPQYKPNILPFGIVPLPFDSPMLAPVYPDSRLQNGSIGIKLNIELVSVDGSVSYFDGYNPMPGIAVGSQEPAQSSGSGVFMYAYRQRVWGADFSTTLGGFGVRGEIGYRHIKDDYVENPFLPHNDIQYILGVDMAFGDFSLLLQYMGRYVYDFTELPSRLPVSNPAIAARLQMEKFNRMIAQQQYEVSHSLSGRISYSMLFETLMLDIFSMVNFSTDEVLFRPKCSYELTDALELSVGAEYYSGPDETLYGMFGDVLSALFVELKVSF
jgi:hypothetical protein